MMPLTKVLSIIKELGWLGAAIVTIAAGIWVGTTYLHNTRLTYQKTFNDKQLETVFEAATTVGELVSARTLNKWEERKMRFWELYLGRLILFESQETASAMAALGNQLNKTPFEQREILRSDVLAVSRSLRKFLEQRNENDWRITFDTLISTKQ